MTRESNFPKQTEKDLLAIMDRFIELCPQSPRIFLDSEQGERYQRIVKKAEKLPSLYPGVLPESYRGKAIQFLAGRKRYGKRSTPRLGL